jgi:hypothetical protein
MKKENKKIPQVSCIKTDTPSPNFKVVLRLIVAFVSVYFMISAWDDVLDEAIRNYFHLQDTVGGRLVRAIIASTIAIVVLMIVRIDLDDLMGAFVHD